MEQGTEIKVIDDLNQHMEEDRARDQTEPEPELAHDELEQEGEGQADRRGHEPLERLLDRLEGDRGARPLAAAADKEQEGQHEQTDRGDACARDQSCAAREFVIGYEIAQEGHVNLLGTGHEIADDRAAPGDECIQRTFGQTGEGRVGDHHQAAAQRADQGQAELRPDAQQHGDDRVACHHRAEHRNRVVEQEEGQMAHDAGQHVPRRDRAAEAHGAGGGQRQQQDDQVDRNDGGNAGHILHEEEPSPADGQSMVKIDLPLVVQVAEHRHAAQDGQHDEHQLEQRIVERNDEGNALAHGLEQALGRRQPRACRPARRIALQCGQIFIILLDGEHDRQGQRGQAAERGQRDRPQSARQVLPHQLREQVF